MDYPIWNVPYFGGAMVIASIAIVHVFIAQFAVGAGIFNACTETFALRRADEPLRSFLRDNSRLIILLPFIIGVVSGVGMWFAVSLVSPETTATLVHLLLWAWAIEGVLFLVQIIAGYVYYFSWDWIGPGWHCLIGWIYALAAAASLVVMNGIVNFMITPGEALDSTVTPMKFNFWAGLFNPSYWPSLSLRAIGSLALAALFAMVLVNARKSYSVSQRERVIRLAGRFLLPLVLAIPAGVWYLLCCPRQSLTYLAGGAIAMALLFAFSLVTSFLLGCYSYAAIIVRKRPVSLETAVLLLVLAFIATGASEFVREGLRKPYLIWDHIYSNGIRKSQLAVIREELDQQNVLMDEATLGGLGGQAVEFPRDTVLQFCRWAIKPNQAEAVLTISDEAFLAFDTDIFVNKLRETLAGKVVRGRWIYEAHCLRCHCIDGYNAIRPIVSNWSPQMTRRALDDLERIRLFMPPFVGSPSDAEDLAWYMHTLDRRCSECHEDMDDEGNTIIPAPDPNSEPRP